MPSIRLLIWACCWIPFWVGTGAWAGDSEIRLVVLERDKQPLKEVISVDHSILRRELLRQSLLFCAREEFGLKTRDLLLGEGDPENVPSLRLALFVDTPLNGPPGRSLWKVAKAERTKLAEWPATTSSLYSPNISGDLQLSRQEFVAALQKAGLTRRVRKTNLDAQVPNSCLQALNDLNFVSQFKAIRMLHQELENEGEAPALLSALSRGYANLGILTEHHWHPAHQAFKARSLLYAQRLCTDHANRPESLETRGYAWALVGFHELALEDFQQAFMNRDPESLTPDWALLAESLARYQVSGLELKADHPLYELSLLFKFLAYEQGGSVGQMAGFSLTALQVLPDCYRIYEGASAQAGVSLNHRLTELAPAIFTSTLPAQLQEFSDLPLDARAALRRKGWEIFFGQDELAKRRQVVQALLQSIASPVAPTEQEPAGPQKIQDKKEQTAEVGTSSPDDGQEVAPPELGEFTFPVLGQLIAETDLVQVARRAYFLTFQLSVPPDDYLDQVQLLYADHRYKPLIDCVRQKEADKQSRPYRKWMCTISSCKCRSSSCEPWGTNF